MIDQSFPLLPEKELKQLETSLNFFHVEELKDIALKLSLPKKSKKGALIHRIVHFLRTGDTKSDSEIPTISCAKRGQEYPLTSNTLILKGAYKNDLATRLFFKKLIGTYFHFTAFGIDWVNERWLEGNPPTYQEFADMWIKEYTRRKEEGSQPKHEWAYINLAQKFMKEHPNGSKKDLLEAWDRTRKKNLEIAHEILEKALRG